MYTTKYKVEFDHKYEYRVVATQEISDDYEGEVDGYVAKNQLMNLVVFRGSLSDCEAFIRLNEGGYM